MSIKILSIGTVVALATLVFMQLIFGRFKSKIRSQTKKVRLLSLDSILYLLLYVLILAVPVVMVVINPGGITLNYIIISVYALLMGLLHTSTFYKIVKWAEKGVDIFPDILYTTVITLLGSIVLLELISMFAESVNGFDYRVAYRFTLLPFLIGILSVKTLFLLKEVPELDYPKFRISNGNRNVSPQQIRNSTQIEAVLKMPLSNETEELTTFDCKLLSDVEFGIVMYMIVDQYNRRPEYPDINTYDKNGKEYEYLFYFKPGWLGRKKFINPEAFVLRNKINRNDIIIVQRYEQKNSRS